MATLDSAERERIDLKLVELVKTREVLYNGKNSNNCHSDIRSKLWNDIATELNQIFNLNRYVDEWKTRWFALRASFRQGLLSPMIRRSNNVCAEMEFLRPYTHISGRTSRGNYNKSAKKLSKMKKVHKIQTNPPNRMKRERNCSKKVQMNGGYADSPMTYDDSNYEKDMWKPVKKIKRETVEANNECFEIIVPDEAEVAEINDELSVNTGNQLSSGDPFDEDVEDSDGAFGTLITRELREMSPATKREFKRTVTQLLYS